MPNPVLIKELVALPERVQPGDFVLRLSEGVSEAGAAATLREYVVTPDLARNFDTALGAIESALDSRSSKAGYLHGSFGSGKSHFMAVLFLLLKGDPRARAIQELAPALQAHECFGPAATWPWRATASSRSTGGSPRSANMRRPWATTRWSSSWTN